MAGRLAVWTEPWWVDCLAVWMVGKTVEMLVCEWVAHWVGRWETSMAVCSAGHWAACSVAAKVAPSGF